MDENYITACNPIPLLRVHMPDEAVARERGMTCVDFEEILIRAGGYISLVWLAQRRVEKEERIEYD